jgi:asparagine synthase (glutamine-hydrolysing)
MISENTVSIHSRFRSIFEKAIHKTGKCQGILLSGGLDTSILVDYGNKNGLDLDHAVTVICKRVSDDDSQVQLAPNTFLKEFISSDEPFAIQIALNHGLHHHLVRVSSPLELIDPAHDGILYQTIRILETFDPMELRGGLSIMKSLMKCQELGISKVVTGDGADELFAGYSFMTGMSREKLRNYMDTMTETMSFSAKALGKALGIEVCQPFLDEEVVSFSKSLYKEDLVGWVKMEENGNVKILQDEPTDIIDEQEQVVRHGKWILRKAFPEAYSRWRVKVPAETGSGSSLIGLEFQKDVYNTPLVRQEMEDAMKEYGIKIRDAEHLHYFKVFNRIFGAGSLDEKGRAIFKTKRVRNGTDPCISCGFQIDSPLQWFCVVCGAWPAREGMPPSN